MEMEQIDLSDPKKFFGELVKKALTGKQSNFEFIRTKDMMHVANLYKRGTKKVYKVFDNLHKALVKQYGDSILTSEQSLETIMAIKQFEVCRDYYKKEVAIAKDMLKEYRTYVFSGHILVQLLFNGVRPDDECVDYRKLPWKLF